MNKKNWQRSLKFLSILSVSLFFNHCATTSKSRVVVPADLTLETLQSKVSQNYHRLQSFEGEARVIIELPGSGHNGFSEVFINFPDSIFIKTEAMLGIDIGSLFLNHRHFAAYAPRENIFYYGETENLDLREFLQVELKTEELYEALTGLVQVPMNASSRLSSDDGKLLVTATVEAGDLKLWIDPEKFLVTKSQLLDPSGKVLLSKEMQRIRRRNGVELPQIIRLTRPQARERITVYYTGQKVNASISPAKFKLKHASNARRVYWGDLERPQVDRNLMK